MPQITGPINAWVTIPINTTDVVVTIRLNTLELSSIIPKPIVLAGKESKPTRLQTVAQREFRKFDIIVDPQAANLYHFVNILSNNNVNQMNDIEIFNQNGCIKVEREVENNNISTTFILDYTLL